jgi:GTP-binding protein
MSQFLDEVRIQIRSGDGGNGIVAWRREKYEPLGGPAGGTGGKGASVYLQASMSVNTLLQYKFKANFEAAHGARGGPKNKHGRDSSELVLMVPPGTVVTDLEGDKIIADLINDGDRVMVAAGGRGGRGNSQLATPTRRAPHFCEPGELGISRKLKLELKLLADAGLVGLPNAGKSSLLSVITAAHPKIGDYPFTTLEPNLGVIHKLNGDGYVLADVPGLIEGASSGAGLGHQFLKHLERTRLLVHMVDASIAEELEQNIQTINQELCSYGERLAQLPQILVLNKIDLLTPDDRIQINSDFLRRIEGMYQNTGLARPLDVVAMSCATHENLEQLHKLLLQRLAELPAPQHLYDIQPDLGSTEHELDSFNVEKHKGRFIVSGIRQERLITVTNLKDPESMHHMFAVLNAMGVVDELYRLGIKAGDEVVIGKTSFEWQ